MKKLFIVLICCMAIVGCQESLQDRAEREAKEYTKKNCPMPVNQMMTLDSMTFDKATSTLYNYYTINGVADDREHIKKIEQEMRESLIKELHESTTQRAYKDAGFSYRYVMYSQNEGSILFDTTVKKEDYQ